jgi:hypothetical protein
MAAPTAGFPIMGPPMMFACAPMSTRLAAAGLELGGMRPRAWKSISVQEDHFPRVKFIFRTRKSFPAREDHFPLEKIISRTGSSSPAREVHFPHGKLIFTRGRRP